MECTTVKQVKARKAYRCYWCGEEISQGERHATWACFDGGSATTTRCHTECEAAWQRAYQSDPWYYGEEVACSEHSRGCGCQRGRCECEKAATMRGEL